MGPIQIFGTKKCADTRKAERFWKERGIKVHSVDLKQKAMSPGELRSVAQRVGGLDALVDKTSPRYRERGLHVSSYSGKLLEPILLEEPLLLKTPIVRNGSQATLGYEPDTWLAWIAAG
ncbi:MAG: ArsC/Spx/MgsR family protein [Polyangia bacterium]